MESIVVVLALIVSILTLFLLHYLFSKEQRQCPKCQSFKTSQVGEWDGTEDWQCKHCKHYFFTDYKGKLVP